MKRLFLILAVIAPFIALSGCGDSDELTTYEITGEWFYGSMPSLDSYDYTQIILAPDGTVSSTRSVMKPGDKRESVTNLMGLWWLDGKKLTVSYIFLSEDVYTIKAIDSHRQLMVMTSPDGGETVWYRRAIDLPKD